MARNEWTRWGRGDCVGCSLSIGSGSVRFDAGVSRSVRGADGAHSWSSAINGKCSQTHATMEEAMTRLEFELRIAAEQFVREYEGYKAQRLRNRFSRAVDAARNGAA
jgi:hypothetical protein